MSDVVLFGGTSEGRRLSELLAELGMAARVCVATEYGRALLDADPSLADAGQVCVDSGRLDVAGMIDLLNREQPRLVIDATHPFALVVHENIRQACERLNLCRLRVLRPREETPPEPDVRYFERLDEMIDWLNGNDEIVFASLGAKEAARLTAVREFERRVFLRLLPDPENLRRCLDLGWPPAHLICMQGPFSDALNQALFQSCQARILVSRESGAAGGMAQKLAAARACDMQIALLVRPPETDGVSLASAEELLRQMAAPQRRGEESECPEE